jgi:hypothetical protein
MWPFNKMIERARTRKAFSLYLSPEMVERAAASAADMLPKRTEISFIIFQVRDDPPEIVRTHLERAFPLIHQHGGVIEVIFSSLSLVSFGLIPSGAPDRRVEVAESLLSALGTDVRLVHGKTEGLFGMHGRDFGLFFGCLIPGTGQLLAKLLQLDFGQSAEV